MKKREILGNGSIRERIVNDYVPTSVKTVFTNFNDSWRRIRKERTCYVCGEPWAEGDSISLVMFTNQKNKPTCRDCAVSIGKRIDPGAPDEEYFKRREEAAEA